MFKQGRARGARGQPVGTFPQSDLLWALGSVSALHRRAFAPEIIASEFPGEASESSLIQAARKLGFRTKTIQAEAGRLAKLPMPLLVAVLPRRRLPNPKHPQIASPPNAWASSPRRPTASWCSSRLAPTPPSPSPKPNWPQGWPGQPGC